MRKKLGEILVEAGLLNAEQLRQGLAEQRRWGGPLGRILIDMGLVPEDTMVRALTRQLGLPSVDLDQVKIEPSVRDLIDGDLAERHGVIPFQVEGKVLDVAMSDATNLGVIDELRIRTHLEVRPFLAGPKAIERALTRHYGRGAASLEVSELRSMALAPSQPGRPLPQATPAPGAKPAPPPDLGVVAAHLSTLIREVQSLQTRMQQVEALVARDEDVLRHVLALFIDKGLVTREEILARLK